MNTLKPQKITPFLWFDGKAEEAMRFYTSLFTNSEITRLKKWDKEVPFPSVREGQVMEGTFVLDGFELHAFDAGPLFKFNPSISFFVIYESEDEVNKLWEKLIDGGEAMMPLDHYEWSDRYGWLTDQFGISWQLMTGKLEDVGQRVTPLLFFTGSQWGRAEEAMHFYMSVFKNSSLDGIAKYGPEGGKNEGKVMHGQCKLMEQTFMAMDSAVDNDFPFNEATSLFVSCKDQAEVDYYWEKLTDGGQESQCGWLKDKFGVSWQIVPETYVRIMDSGKQANIKNVMEALMQMKKLDIAQLEEAFNQPV